MLLKTENDIKILAVTHPYNREYILLWLSSVQFTDESDGSVSFRCQHGPYECVGNKYLGCLLAREKDQAKQEDVVHCIMKDDMPERAMEKVKPCVLYRLPTKFIIIRSFKDL